MADSKYVYYKDIINKKSDFTEDENELNNKEELINYIKLHAGFDDIKLEDQEISYPWYGGKGYLDGWKTLAIISIKYNNLSTTKFKLGDGTEAITFTKDSSKTGNWFKSDKPTRGLSFLHIGFAMNIQDTYKLNSKDVMPWWNAELVDKVANTVTDNITDNQIIYCNANKDRLSDNSLMQRIAKNKTQNSFYVHNKSIKNLAWNDNNLMDQNQISGFFNNNELPKQKENNKYDYNPLFNFTPEWYPEIIFDNMNELISEEEIDYKIEKVNQELIYTKTELNQSTSKKYKFNNWDRLILYVRGDKIDSCKKTEELVVFKEHDWKDNILPTQPYYDTPHIIKHSRPNKTEVKLNTAFPNSKTKSIINTDYKDLPLKLFEMKNSLVHFTNHTNLASFKITSGSSIINHTPIFDSIIKTYNLSLDVFFSDNEFIDDYKTVRGFNLVEMNGKLRKEQSIFNIQWNINNLQSINQCNLNQLSYFTNDFNWLIQTYQDYVNKEARLDYYCYSICNNKTVLPGLNLSTLYYMNQKVLFDHWGPTGTSGINTSIITSSIGIHPKYNDAVGVAVVIWHHRDPLT